MSITLVSIPTFFIFIRIYLHGLKDNNEFRVHERERVESKVLQTHDCDRLDLLVQADQAPSFNIRG